MSNDTEELVDNGSDSDVETIETGIDETPDDPSDDEQTKKNKSNWKKVSEKAKLADKLERELEEAKQALKEWEELNPDIASTKAESKRLDGMETRLFFAENPDAKEHKERIEEVIAKSKWTLSREDAWELIKPSIPKESESKTNFSTKSPPVNSKKNIMDLDAEEALKLPKDQYNKWAAKKYWF